MLLTHEVPDGVEDIRLDAYSVAAFAPIGSRSMARKLLKKGALRVVGLEARSGWWVKPGWVLELEPPDTLPGPAYERPLDFVYVDDFMAVVDKPPGLVVGGNRHRTLARALPHALPRSPAPDALAIPVPVHRLDARTQGLVVVARTAAAQRALGHAFEARTVEKRYEALVVGKLEGEGTVDTPLTGREASTRWRAEAWARSLHVGWVTRVRVWPRTGRTHQIRRHLAELGHAVLGDGVYRTTDRVLTGNGLYLAALALALPHPITGERIEVERPRPPKFDSFLAREQRRWDRHHSP